MAIKRDAMKHKKQKKQQHGVPSISMFRTAPHAKKKNKEKSMGSPPKSISDSYSSMQPDIVHPAPLRTIPGHMP